MSPETARLVAYLILGAGFLVWLFALLFHRRSFRPVDPMDPTLVREDEVDVPAAVGVVRDRFVDAIRGGAGISPFLLEEASERTIRGLATMTMKGQQRGSLRFRVELSDGGSGTRATVRIRRASPVGGLQWAGRLFVYGLGPIALITAAWLILTRVLPSEDPRVREQALQAIQCVHFLWPPFLFGGLHRKVITFVSTMIGNALRNAAF